MFDWHSILLAWEEILAMEGEIREIKTAKTAATTISSTREKLCFDLNIIKKCLFKESNYKEEVKKKKN